MSGNNLTDTIPQLSTTEIKVDSVANSEIVSSIDFPNVVIDTTSLFTFKSEPVSLYHLPYSRSLNIPNYKRLWINTGALVGGGLLALGILQMLPEGTTAWNKTKLSRVPFFQRWGDHVKDGPVWDNDNFVFNYVLHPYGGAVYYMTARSQGFNIAYSSLYCLCISTLYWEYGIEAFMEVPSIQDLIVTPLSGVVLGEGFYLIKRELVAHNYRVLGSRFIGGFIAFVIDPVNELVGLFAGNPARETYPKVSTAPMLMLNNHVKTVGFTVSIIL